MNKTCVEIGLPGLLQEFFCQRLIQQQHVSHNTVKSYRDTFRLLLRFAEGRTGKSVTELDLNDLDAPLTLAFLDHLEVQRSNTIRSRNARLAAIRSFFIMQPSRGQQPCRRYNACQPFP